MKTALLVRGLSTDEGTPGVFTTGDGVLQLKSLELPWRDVNKDGFGDPQHSCITPGTYECVWEESPSKGWCYRLKNVTGRTGILIHAGNWAGDTELGYKSDVLGCILLGYAIGKLEAFGKLQLAIVRDGKNRGSKSAISALRGWGAKEQFNLTIRDSQSL